MRILINGLNYAPDLIGVPKYTTEMAEWLASSGHEVRVVTGPPYYPSWRVQSPYSGLRYKSERINNVDIIRCPLYVPNHPGGTRRVLHLSSFALASLPVVLAQALAFRPDVVMAIAPTLLSAPATLLAARLSRAKAWLHVQDFELEAAFSLGLLKAGPVQCAARATEGMLLRAFDRISTISQPMIDLLRKKGCRPDQVQLFRNWADSDLVPQKGRNHYRELLGLSDDHILVLYSGTMSRKQGLEIVVDAAHELSNVKHIQFLMCGD
ncbi:MAG: WcaI family glycosyltransferase, partial [Alphaproteobacteria bacterium]